MSVLLSLVGYIANMCLQVYPNRSCIGKAIQVYHEDMFEDEGVYSITPII